VSQEMGEGEGGAVRQPKAVVVHPMLTCSTATGRKGFLEGGSSPAKVGKGGERLKKPQEEL